MDESIRFLVICGGLGMLFLIMLHVGIEVFGIGDVNSRVSYGEMQQDYWSEVELTDYLLSRQGFESISGGRGRVCFCANETTSIGITCGEDRGCEEYLGCDDRCSEFYKLKRRRE